MSLISPVNLFFVCECVCECVCVCVCVCARARVHALLPVLPAILSGFLKHLSMA
jgi:hypothetical protein